MSFHQPATLDAALELIARDGCRIIAGGTDVYPALQPGRAPKSLVDVTGVAGLRGVFRTGNEIRFGAATTWSDILRADLPRAFDGLKAAAREVGSVQIQNTGTIAGNLCNASPAADGAPPLLTLEAEVECVSAARGVRRAPLSEFITYVRQTVLEPDELVSAVVIPEPAPEARSAFVKLGSRKYLVISIAMCAAHMRLDGAGRICEARVAVGACAPVAKRLPALEAALIGAAPDQVLVRPEHLAPLSPISDARGTAAYRQEVVAEICARAIRKAAAHE